VATISTINISPFGWRNGLGKEGCLSYVYVMQESLYRPYKRGLLNALLGFLVYTELHVCYF